MINAFCFLQVQPTAGTVGFGSGLHGWAFTLKQFAEIYAAKFKIEPPQLMKRLFGDQFYNPKEKKWNKVGGEGYVRGFNQFVLDPIFKVNDCLLPSKISKPSSDTSASFKAFIILSVVRGLHIPAKLQVCSSSESVSPV